MALLTWDDKKYSVGVKSMDAQHTILFNMINELHEAMLQGRAQSVTGPLLQKLIQYTQEHFSSEEKALFVAEYPDLNAHQARHRDLIKQVSEFQERFDKGEVTVNLHLLNFLRDWLVRHIQQEDREYGSWMNEHGTH